MRHGIVQEVQEQLLKRRFHSSELLRELGIPTLPPLTSVADIGIDPLTVESHLQQSSHLIAMLKIASSGWLIAEENAVRQKVAAARRYNIPAAAGGGLFRYSHMKRRSEDYFELCSDIGFTSAEIDHHTVLSAVRPRDIVVSMADRELQCIAEVAVENHTYSQRKSVEPLVERAKEWLNAGAGHIAVASIEKQPSIRALTSRPLLDYRYVEAFARTFGLPTVLFETTTLESCKLLIDHFGAEVSVSGIGFQQILEVESYRRGLYRNLHHQYSKQTGGSSRTMNQAVHHQSLPG